MKHLITSLLVFISLTQNGLPQTLFPDSFDEQAQAKSTSKNEDDFIYKSNNGSGIDISKRPKEIQLEIDKLSQKVTEEYRRQKNSEKLEHRLFLSSIGLYASIGAILLGVFTLFVRIPHFRLERKKLELEIKILELQNTQK